MILPLKKNITIEQTFGGLPAGSLTYKKETFGIFVDLQNFDILNDSFSIILRIIRIEDNQIINTIGEQIPISKVGRDGKKVLNQDEIDAYVLADTSLKTSIDKTREELRILRDDFQILKNSLKEKEAALKDNVQGKEKLEKIKNPTKEEIDAIAELEVVITGINEELVQINADYQAKAEETGVKDNDLQKLRDERNALVEVKPDYEKIDKYADIVGTNIENNKLTTSGLEWVKGLPLLGKTAGEYV